MNSGHGAVVASVLRQPYVAPPRKRSVDALVEHREHQRQVILDHVTLLLDRVRILAKCERRRHVDGVARQVARHLDRFAAFGGARPMPVQPLGDRLQRREETSEVRCRQRAHHQLALRPPRLAFDRKDAVGARLCDAGFDLAYAPVAFRPFAQHLVQDIGIIADESPLRPEAQHERRAEFGTPTFEGHVQPCRVELMQVAEQRQALGRRQFLQQADSCIGERQRHVGLPRRRPPVCPLRSRLATLPRIEPDPPTPLISRAPSCPPRSGTTTSSRASPPRCNTSATTTRPTT